MELTKNDTQTLVDDLQSLRDKLQAETNSATRLQEAYGAECQELDNRSDANALAAKQRLDISLSRIERMRADISRKQRELDEFQGCEVEENRRKQVQQELELASKRLAASQAEIAKLKAEYVALTEKIPLAESLFNQALRAFNVARRKSVECCF
jgi:uncharacterized small protein (DUF1192 family)